MHLQIVEIIKLTFDGVFLPLVFMGGGADCILPLFTCENNRKGTFFGEYTNFSSPGIRLVINELTQLIKK